MARWLRYTRTALACCAALTFAACGGGGGGSAATSGGGGGPPPDPTWTAGVYAAPASLAAYCAAPRSGTDLATGKPYPDKLGSAVWENHFLRAWTHAYYLWYSEVADLNPAPYTTKSYFDLLKTTAVTASSNPKDKFHFTHPTSAWEQLSRTGVQAGYGVTWVLLSPPKTLPRKLVAAYTEPGTPAIAAGLARGAEVVTVDGADLVNINTQAGVDVLNAGLFPAAGGESHTFGVVDTPGAAARSVTLISAAIASTPVQNVHTLPGATGLVGYFQFNDHIATAESVLIAAFTQLQQAHVAELVIDIRYNGGGYLAIASEVAFMVAGPGRTAGKTFEQQSFNDQYPSTNPITGAALAPEPFLDVALGLDPSAAGTPPGTPLPHLDLARVFVLTGPGTCSASEAIMNGLNGVGVQVVEIGSTTCGKPYGFYPQDNCGTTYFSIEFKGINALGFGDYTDGFSPANAVTRIASPLPGCSVVDDFTKQLGDPAEARLAAALGYLATQTCPLATGLEPPASPLHADGVMAKSEWLMNRIMRNAAQ